MGQPFLGEIRMFAGNFAPRGWALCNGQLLAISSNTALFSLLGTYYGGNGTSTFALPNLQGSAAMHQGQGPGLTPRSIGETGGETAVTLTTQQVPAHTHTFNCGTGTRGNTATVTGQFNADQGAGTTPIYATAGDGTSMNAVAVQPLGSQPHENMQPYQCVTFIIALQGIFPARS